ncbi:hypothetical protein AB0I49_34720 [Streptomyces sp. NPDC050617]|uniref:aromatic-ring hydroxylase C-terminal domain-containing protein n=1 Tax=Streptomyces sp. NPDC050617 TaxID=3154628 RepID=UPI00343FDE7E
MPVLDDASVEFGRLYRSAAVLGADAGLPPVRRPEEWAGQSGTRAPHLWVAVDGEERSTLDLFRRDWVLLSEDERWAAAATRAAERSGIPVTFVRIGTDAHPVEPAAFRTAYGLG